MHLDSLINVLLIRANFQIELKKKDINGRQFQKKTTIITKYFALHNYKTKTDTRGRPAKY